MRRPATPIALAALCAALAGCAQLHPRSAGDHNPAATQAPQARQPTDPNHPTKTIDPRDQSATPAPPRTLPIPGTSPDPFATAPQGALPNPYANPPR